jgi:tight adherence protein C
MTTAQIFYLLIIFGVTAAVAYGVMTVLTGGTTKERLKSVAGGAAPAEAGVPKWKTRILELAEPVAHLALPSEGWEKAPLRMRFINAGYRNTAAPTLYFVAKTILTFALPGIFAAYVGLSHMIIKGNVLLVLLLLLAAVGYYLPNFLLQRRIFVRKREIFEALPDALDLMTVCVEAGLAMDAAIARVGDEMRLTSPALADEFHLANLELRAGASREQALRNLALRSGVEEVDSLVTMLVQSDRFGTSVADSLRIHSESLRTKRRLRAEETAAKIPVKLLFPMIFFIFPSLLLVLLGPALIAIFRILIPTVTGVR